jgi:hypothetical protein
MGVTYHYSNLTKREWFAADALDGNSKRGGLGLGLTARAFDLLLLGGQPAPASGKVHLGRWSCDSVTLIGDTDENWLRYLEEFSDIDADVILMMYAEDGFENIGTAAEGDRSLFMELCHLVVTRQALQLEAEMTRQFGPNFRKRYKDFCAERHWFKPKDVAFPAGS